MHTEEVTLEAGSGNFPGRLNVPEEPTRRGVLVIPGAGHGPFEDVFDTFAAAAADAGVTAARFETWTDREDLEAKTPEQFREEIEAGVGVLRDRGCRTVTVVAKSFGGRLALEFATESADRMVLWAPAVLVGDRDDAPTITGDELADVDVPTKIIQGNEDEVVSADNAAAMVEHLPDAELVELPGEDHSFLHDEERVVDETLAFLAE